MERFPSAVRRRTVLKGMAAVSAGLLGAARSGSSVGEIATKPARVHPSVPASRPLTKSWLAKQHAAGDDGTELSDPKARFMRRGWVDAVVPGTVLTTLLNNGLIDDPYFGVNNQEIPDAGPSNVAAYTYWFRVPLDVPHGAGRNGGRIFLDLRGVNYTADVYLNGSNLTAPGPLTGMFLRHRLDVTSIARPGKANILAVLVTPPDPPGDPKTAQGEFEPAGSSCQGGDRQIGRSVVNQVTGGWDFWQPVRDRNTGIWDRISLSITGPVVFATDPKITTAITWQGDTNVASSADVTVTAQAHNTAATRVRVDLQVTIGGAGTGRASAVIGAGETATLTTTVTIDDPQLWWPHGYGDAHLYATDVTLSADGDTSDRYKARIGIREASSDVDTTTLGRKFTVNRTPVFIRGGAWVAADALLRLSPQNYDDQVRLHQQANVNLIRIWGGSIAERPEFYEACDKYGVLVWQEFWVTADCTIGGLNPADPQQFLACATDTVRMLRNHPSLCLWVGGNEGPPPTVGDGTNSSIDLDTALAELITDEDGTRPYVSFSTDFAAGLGTQPVPPGFPSFTDGPYGMIYPWQFFDGSWTEHKIRNKPQPFTPETGSVGTPVAETIRAIMERAHAEDFPKVTQETWPPNDGWNLHLWIPFFNGDPLVKDQLLLYKTPTTLDEFCEQAQAAQYQQYKAMFEGRNAAMWSWYTGGVLWRSAPGWTGLRGYIYDWYLEQTGGYWGMRKAGEPLHAQLDLATYDVAVVNNTRHNSAPLTLTIDVVDASGRIQQAKTRTITTPRLPAASQTVVTNLATALDLDAFQLVKLRLTGAGGQALSDNTNWLVNTPPGTPQPDFGYAPLRALPTVTLEAAGTGTTRNGESTVHLTLRNTGDAIAFQIRIRVTHRRKSQRITPVFATDNYLTLLPAEQAAVEFRFPTPTHGKPRITAEGWNTRLARRSREVPVDWG
jgi:mannosylglycoprotein endo-beta-mannosidase